MSCVNACVCNVKNSIIELIATDSPTKVNHLDVDTMSEYWSHDPENITVNAVKIAKDDPTAIRG